MKTIYVLGNSACSEDTLPVLLLPRLVSELPDFRFIHLDPTENLPEEEHLILIDTIFGIDSVRVLYDLDKIENSPQYSLHDFDLGFQLKLMKKLGKIGKVTIIGVPEKGEAREILNQIKKSLNKIIYRNRCRTSYE
jgi:Ni,Fe-hydrogenase maturation factor